MGMLKEFKEFAMRGNVVDLAIGVVIGGAFGKIVSSMVEKIVMPAIGYVTGGVDFSKHDIVLKKGTGDTPDIVLGVGSFATTVIDFVIIAFVIFLVVKALNSMKKKEEAAPAAPAEEVVLLREIRDSLKR